MVCLKGTWVTEVSRAPFGNIWRPNGVRGVRQFMTRHKPCRTIGHAGIVNYARRLVAGKKSFSIL